MRTLNAVLFTLLVPAVTLLVPTVGVALAQPEAAADPNTPLPGPAAAETTAPAVADGATALEPALEDYEASEQISEDLSVAFPVDI
jgi:hypothetical protein